MSLFLFQNLKIVCARGSRVSVRTWGPLKARHPHGRNLFGGYLMKSNPSNQAPESSSINLVMVGDDKKVITTSVMVSEYFGKRHCHVMRDIENLLESDQLRGQSNFGSSNYLNKQGKEQPMYTMDRTGFTLLAMGFTGKKALDFKIRYIQAFDSMEAELANQSGGFVAVPAGTSRVCGACGKEKHLTDFYRNRSTRDGYAWECKTCSREMKQQMYDRNAVRNDPNAVMIPMKVCQECGKEKRLTDFYMDKTTDDKRSGLCKLCSQAMARSKVVSCVQALPGPDPQRPRMASDAAMELILHFKEMVRMLREDVATYRKMWMDCHKELNR